jgi:hypothetical protein
MESTQVRDLPTFSLPGEGIRDLPNLDDPFEGIREHDPRMDWEGSSVGQSELALRGDSDTEIREQLAMGDPKVIDGEWTDGAPVDFITEPQTQVAAADDLRQFGWAPPEKTPEDEDLGLGYGPCIQIIPPDAAEEENVGIGDIFAGALGSLWDKIGGSDDSVGQVAGSPTWVGVGPTMQERLRPQETPAAPTMAPRFVEATPLTPETPPGGDVQESTEFIPSDEPLALTDGREAHDGLWSHLQDTTQRS